MFETDEKTFQTIYKLLTFILIAPRWDFRNNRRSKNPFAYKIFIFLCVPTPILIILIHSIYRELLAFRTHPELIAPIFRSISMLFTALLTAFLVIVGNDQEWYDFLEFLYVKKVFSSYNTNKNLPATFPKNKMLHTFLLFRGYGFCCLAIRAWTVIVPRASTTQMYFLLLVVYTFSGIVYIYCTQMICFWNCIYLLSNEFRQIKTDLKLLIPYRPGGRIYKTFHKRYVDMIAASHAFNAIFDKTFMVYVGYAMIQMLVYISIGIEKDRTTSTSIFYTASIFMNSTLAMVIRNYVFFKTVFV